MTRFVSFILVAALLNTPALAQVTAPPSPAEVVIQFLSFSETQAAQFRQAIDQLTATLRDIQMRMGGKQQYLNMLLNASAPDVTAIGSAMLDIRGLQIEAERTMERYHSQFLALLTPEQKERVMRVAQARELLPAVMAFAAANLVPPPQGPQE